MSFALQGIAAIFIQICKKLLKIKFFINRTVFNLPALIIISIYLYLISILNIYKSY